MSIPGFSALPTPSKNSIATYFGIPKCGKTSLLSKFAKEPVAVINFDHRAGHVIRQDINAGRKIELAEIDIPNITTSWSEDKIREECGRRLRKFWELWEACIEEAKRGKLRTIGIDTATELGQLMRLAYSGGKEKGDYGRSKDLLNADFLRMAVNIRALPARCDLVLLARSSPIWVDQKPTGEHRHRAPDVVEEISDFVAQLAFEPRVKVNNRSLRVTRSGLNPAMAEKTYWEKDWNALGGPMTYLLYLQFMEFFGLEHWK